MFKIYLAFLSFLLSSFVFTQIPSYLPANGLVAYYPFDGNADDLSGNNHHGSNSGAVLATDRNGISNSCFEFDGIDDYVLIQDHSELDLTGSFSFSVWINSDDVNTQQFIVNKHTWNISDSWLLDLSANNVYANRIRMICAGAGNPGNPQAGGSQSINQSNVWYHVVVTYDLSNVKFYLNGVFDSAENHTASTPLNNNNVTIGCSNDFQHNYFDGKIDELIIYSRALLPCEVAQVYNEQVPNFVSAGSDQTVCEGEAVTLSGSGAQSYNWNNGVTNGQSFTPPIGTTTYTVTGTNSQECTATDDVLITVIENTSSQITIESCDQYVSPSGNTYTTSGNYTETVQNAAGCDSIITISLMVRESTSSSISVNGIDSINVNGVIYTQSGAYQQTIPNSVGCDSSITVNVSLGFTGIAESQLNNFNVYPNPTSGDVLFLKGDFQEKIEFEVMNNLGQVMLVFKTIDGQINISNLPDGVYFIKSKGFSSPPQRFIKS